MKSQGAKVDSWGIGTKLITAYDQPALGAVYKMVSIENSEGEMEDTIKHEEKEVTNVDLLRRISQLEKIIFGKEQ